MKRVKTMSDQIDRLGKLLLVILPCIVVSACTTARVEDVRVTATGILDGEGVVIMARSYHLGNETEDKFIKCVSAALARGASALRVVPNSEFVDALFPWFEPRTAPADTNELPDLLARPGVAHRIAAKGVRYVIWLDGDTERVSQGGSLSCAIGPGGGGCFGFAWWQDDADYEALIWDLDDSETAGSVTADFSGTSFLPALVVPIPLIARTQSRACKGLAKQLKLFIVSSDTA